MTTNKEKRPLTKEESSILFDYFHNKSSEDIAEAEYQEFMESDFFQEEVAEHIRQPTASKSVDYQARSINVTVSLGVAVIEAEDTRYEDLISNADIALYEAKSNGRNRVCLAKQCPTKETIVAWIFLSNIQSSDILYIN